MSRMTPLLATLLTIFAVAPLALGGELPVILNMQDRAALQDQWLEIRLATVIPQLMERENVDMWIIVSREYNEDPVFWSMKPATWLAARRRTILVFHDTGQGEIDRLAVARYDIGKFFRKAWEPEEQPDQWSRLAQIVQQRNPLRIALNYSQHFALGDGITHSEFQALTRALPKNYQERLVSGEKLAIGWLEWRIPEEQEVYPTVCRIAHEIIAEGLSERVIQPGFTTTEDVQWWYRDRIRELGLTTWFHPSVSVQRADDAEMRTSFASRPSEQTIRRGDLIHIDFGIHYLGLNTDTQQHAYVLRPGEKDAPEGLKRALAQGNRLQDLLTSNFIEGRSGNDILKESLEQAVAEGLAPSIYTHPIGFHGHAAGPTIGLWDQQQGVPVRGDYPLHYDTAHSIELNVTVEIPEWNGKKIRIMLEEDAIFTRQGTRYIDGRQTELHLIQ